MEYDYSRPELFGPIHSKGYVTTPPKQLKQPLGKYNAIAPDESGYGSSTDQDG